MKRINAIGIVIAIIAYEISSLRSFKNSRNFYALVAVESSKIGTFIRSQVNRDVAGIFWGGGPIMKNLEEEGGADHQKQWKLSFFGLKMLSFGRPHPKIA